MTATPLRATREHDQADLENLVEELAPEHILCRDLRHAWSLTADFYVSDRTTPSVRDVARDLTCARCGTIRHEKYILRHWGLEKTGSNYTYPEGYVLKGVPLGASASQAVRDLQYRRAKSRLADLRLI